MAINFDGLCPLLHVFDKPKSVNFYRDVLGFELVGNSRIVRSPEGEYFHWAMLRRGSTTLMLNTAYDEGERPPAPDAARVAAHGDTVLFFGCSDVDAAFHQLLPLGVHVLEKPMTTVYKMRRFAIADPDGYNLCFQGPVTAQCGLRFSGDAGPLNSFPLVDFVGRRGRHHVPVLPFGQG